MSTCLEAGYSVWGHDDFAACSLQLRSNHNHFSAQGTCGSVLWPPGNTMLQTLCTELCKDDFLHSLTKWDVFINTAQLHEQSAPRLFCGISFPDLTLSRLQLNASQVTSWAWEWSGWQTGSLYASWQMTPSPLSHYTGHMQPVTPEDPLMWSWAHFCTSSTHCTCCTFSHTVTLTLS